MNWELEKLDDDDLSALHGTMTHEWPTSPGVLSWVDDLYAVLLDEIEKRMEAKK